MSSRNATTTYWARWKFAHLALPLQARARELGYNLIVHGSVMRDIDLVAVPWVEDAVTAETLIDNLILVTKEHNDGCAYFIDPEHGQPNPRAKPHGRLAWSIHLIPDDLSVYLDVSVMPRRSP